MSPMAKKLIWSCSLLMRRVMEKGLSAGTKLSLKTSPNNTCYSVTTSVWRISSSAENLNASLYFFILSKCVFPFYPYSLEQEIERRSNEKRFLTKEELTFLIYQIVDGARNFDRIDEKVGDIRPSQILLNESKKKVKLVNFFTSPNQFTGL